MRLLGPHVNTCPPRENAEDLLLRTPLLSGGCIATAAEPPSLHTRSDGEQWCIVLRADESRRVCHTLAQAERSPDETNDAGTRLCSGSFPLAPGNDHESVCPISW